MICTSFLIHICQYFIYHSNLQKAKEFWVEATVLRLGRETDKKFRWKEDLGFSRSMLSEPFLYYKEKIEIEVRLNKIFQAFAI